MATSIFYTQFRTERAMDLGVKWLGLLDRSVRKAAVNAVMMSFDQPTGFHVAYGNLLDGLRRSGKRGRDAERWYRARLGYVIEAEANQILTTSAPGAGRGWRCVDELPAGGARKGDFLLQTPEPVPPCFPSEFRRWNGGTSRPDVRVALGDGTEALFDITSRGQEGHVLEKGGGHWLTMPTVAFIAEVIYDENEVAEAVAKRAF